MAASYLKVARPGPAFTGAQKAAALFVSLGGAAWEGVAQRLSRKELRAVRMAIKSLDADRVSECALAALEEAERWGRRKGIASEPRPRADAPREAADARVAGKSPDEIAKLIGNWLTEE